MRIAGARVLFAVGDPAEGHEPIGDDARRRLGEDAVNHREDGGVAADDDRDQEWSPSHSAPAPARAHARQSADRWRAAHTAVQVHTDGSLPWPARVAALDQRRRRAGPAIRRGRRSAIAIRRCESSSSSISASRRRPNQPAAHGLIPPVRAAGRFNAWTASLFDHLLPARLLAGEVAASGGGEPVIPGALVVVGGLPLGSQQPPL